MATDLSRRAFLGRAAAGLAAFAALGTADQAAAQQTPGNIRFGQHDVRDRDETGILLAAASASTNGVCLLVRTSDQNVWRTAYQTAHALAEEGYAVSYVLAADGPDRLDIYAGGVEIGRINNPGTGPDSATALRGEMIRAYNLAFTPPQISAAPTSG